MARKVLENRLTNFDRLDPLEQKRTREIEESVKENPESHGDAFPVLDQGRMRPPKASDGPGLDAVMTVQEYFGGGPQTSWVFGVRTPGWYRVKAVAYALKNDGKPTRLKFSAGTFGPGGTPKTETIFTFTDDKPREVEATYYLEPNDRVQFRLLDGAPHSQNRTMPPMCNRRFFGPWQGALTCFAGSVRGIHSEAGYGQLLATPAATACPPNVADFDLSGTPKFPNWAVNGYCLCLATPVIVCSL